MLPCHPASSPPIRLLTLLLAGLSLPMSLLPATPAQAQGYPERAITIVVLTSPSANICAPAFEPVL